MPEFTVIALPVEEAAALLQVQPATVRRRVRAGELGIAETIGPGPAAVRLDPEETWLRVEDASSLLGVSPATVRANIARGRLEGRREAHGRWRVRLRSILEDPRCNREAVAVFTGEAPFADTANAPTERTDRRGRLHRQVNLRLSPEEAEILERGRDRHGTIRAAIVVGLRAADHDQAIDVDELTVEHAYYRDELERERAAHSELRERANGRLVDELYCHVCEGWVPVEECDAAELPDGRLEVFHEIHGHRSGQRFRTDTGLARRAPITRDAGA